MLLSLILVSGATAAERLHRISRDPHTSQNQLRFEFGTNFKYHGNLTHNLDRVWVVTSIPVPDFTKRPPSEFSLDRTCENIRGINSRYALRQGPQRRHILQALTATVDNMCQYYEKKYSSQTHKIKTISRLVDAKVDDIHHALPEIFPPSSKVKRSSPFPLSTLVTQKPQRESLPRVEHTPDRYTAGASRSGTRVYVDDVTFMGGHRRSKRGIWTLLAGGLVTVATEAISWMFRRKRDQAVNKAIKALDKNEADTRNKVKQLGNDFTMHGKFNLKQHQGILDHMKELRTEMDSLRTGIRKNERSIAYAQQQSILHLDYAMKSLYQVSRLEYDLRKLVDTIEQAIDLEETLLHSLSDLSRGIATLAQGRLSPDILPHATLHGIVEAVSNLLKEKYPRYEVAMDRLNNYYDMKLATFLLRPGVQELIVMFPVLVKPRALSSMALYEIETTYVPIPDLNKAADSYTRTIPQKPYIAINKDHYIQLQIPELTKCKSISHHYYCEETFLVKHSSKHTCEAALFYELSDEVVKKNCEFEFVYNKSVVPSVLDGGSELVLANFQSNKELSCWDQNNFDAPFALPKHDYVKVDRKILCNCRIKGDLIEVMSSISACTENATLPPLQFTYNKAFMLYLKEVARFPRQIQLPRNLSFQKLTEELDHEIKTFEDTVLPLKIPITSNGHEPSKTMASLVDNLERQKASFRRVVTRTNHFPKRHDVEVPPYVNYGLIAASGLLTLVIVAIIFLLCKYYDVKSLAMASLTTFVPLPKADALPDNYMHPVDYSDYDYEGSNPELKPHSTLPPSPLPDFPALIEEAVPGETVFASVLKISLACMQILFVLFMIWKLGKRCAFFKGFLFKDSIKLYLFLTDGVRYVSLLIRKVPGSPEQFEGKGEIDPDNLNLQKNCRTDLLIVNYQGYKLLHHQRDSSGMIDSKEVRLPTNITIGFMTKFKVRHLLRQPQVRAFTAIRLHGGWKSPQTAYSDYFEAGPSARKRILSCSQQVETEI